MFLVLCTNYSTNRTQIEEVTVNVPSVIYQAVRSSCPPAFFETMKTHFLLQKVFFDLFLLTSPSLTVRICSKIVFARALRVSKNALTSSSTQLKAISIILRPYPTSITLLCLMRDYFTLGHARRLHQTGDTSQTGKSLTYFLCP